MGLSVFRNLASREIENVLSSFLNVPKTQLIDYYLPVISILIHYFVSYVEVLYIASKLYFPSLRIIYYKSVKYNKLNVKY